MTFLWKLLLVLAISALLLFGLDSYASGCQECFFELCIPVPLGYGWTDCEEDHQVCHNVMISPGPPPIYHLMCFDVCKMKGQPCYDDPSFPG